MGICTISKLVVLKDNLTLTIEPYGEGGGDALLQL